VVGRCAHLQCRWRRGCQGRGGQGVSRQLVGEHVAELGTDLDQRRQPLRWVGPLIPRHRRRWKFSGVGRCRATGVGVRLESGTGESGDRAAVGRTPERTLMPPRGG
jgi:hypothetical protein